MVFAQAWTIARAFEQSAKNSAQPYALKNVAAILLSVEVRNIFFYRLNNELYNISEF